MRRAGVGGPATGRAPRRLSAAAVKAFRAKILDAYARQGRDLPWRRTRKPYAILVSEIMLQQTQVDRVVGKYGAFLEAFPDFSSLARAPHATLLKIWSGLGYNRRALALKKLAQTVVRELGGRLPSDPEKLALLPGIGPYTAGAVAAFAFNKPVICMDTNIRRVYLHEFFRGRKQVADREILPLLEQTLDREHPRRWYNALMDYGSAIKTPQGNPNRASAQYTRQSPFQNSNRQIRGAIVKALIVESPLTEAQLAKRIAMDREQVNRNLAQLAQEGLIRKRGARYRV